MTLREAIDGFEMDNVLLAGKEDGIVDRNIMAIEALKKQRPMKVKDIHVNEYFCPACGTQNNCGDICLIGDSYCPECGQALYQEN
ncbi:hypothetical protein [[Clostridium] symbiosum]|uniref:hypothetical protein n=1 Tax=Clostridium symbiosum TaxID=1512 RepID=UPI0006C7FD12|nr:hypothetical protein [[Clostridium] symbiosum]